MDVGLGEKESNWLVKRDTVKLAMDSTGLRRTSLPIRKVACVLASREDLIRIAQTAIVAALEAGDFFSSKLESQKVIKTKSSPSDLVTDVDPECERRIRAHISRNFPGHEVLGEEATDPGSEASAKATAAVHREDHLWIVDPLDGTTNFVYETPLSVVSIAYAEVGVVMVGVVYDPYRKEVFLGIREQGSWLLSTEAAQEWSQGWGQSATTDSDQSMPGRRLSVSTRETLEESVVATGFPTRAIARDKTTEAGLRLSGRVKSLRAYGSAAMHLAYVAAGRLDGFWEYDLNSWDIAAGALLVEAAGGSILDLDGSPYSLAVRDIVACGQVSLANDIRERVYQSIL